MHACAESCCADSPDSPTFAMPCRADSPDSPTFSEPCCADSPTFAKTCCADSPDSRTLAKGHFREKCDSPRHIRTSNSPFSRIWGEWPLLNFFPKVLVLFSGSWTDRQSVGDWGWRIRDSRGRPKRQTAGRNNVDFGTAAQETSSGQMSLKAWKRLKFCGRSLDFNIS